jgi:hypothetical protein
LGFVEAAGTGWLFVAAFGLPSLAAGVGLCSLRERVVLDRAAGQLVHVYAVGAGRPLWSRRCPLSRWTGVRIRYLSGDADASESHPVELVGADDRKRFRLADPCRYEDARAAGVAIARFLGLPLDDTLAAAAKPG